MSEISKLIKSLRKDKGWSQIDLAKAANLGLVTVQRIEQDAPNYSLKALRKIAFALSVDYNDFRELLAQEERFRESWGGSAEIPAWEKEFIKDFSIFYNNLATKVPPRLHDVLFDNDNLIGFQEILKNAIELDIALLPGMLPKSNKK